VANSSIQKVKVNKNLETLVFLGYFTARENEQ